jgi:hypothetical protein
MLKDNPAFANWTVEMKTHSIQASDLRRPICQVVELP